MLERPGRPAPAHRSLSDAQLNAVYAATDAISRWPLVVDHHPYSTVMEMRTKALRLRARQKDLGLIVVDYLQLMHTAAKAERRDLELAEISRGLSTKRSRMSRRGGLSRPAEGRPQGKP